MIKKIILIIWIFFLWFINTNADYLVKKTNWDIWILSNWVFTSIWIDLNNKTNFFFHLDSITQKRYVSYQCNDNKNYCPHSIYLYDIDEDKYYTITDWWSYDYRKNRANSYPGVVYNNIFYYYNYESGTEKKVIKYNLLNNTFEFHRNYIWNVQLTDNFVSIFHHIKSNKYYFTASSQAYEFDIENMIFLDDRIEWQLYVTPILSDWINNENNIKIDNSKLYNVETKEYVNINVTYTGFEKDEDLKLIENPSNGLTYLSSATSKKCKNVTYKELDYFSKKYNSLYTYNTNSWLIDNNITDLKIENERNYILYYNNNIGYSVDIYDAEHIQWFTWYLLQNENSIKFDSFDLSILREPKMIIRSSQKLDYFILSNTGSSNYITFSTNWKDWKDFIPNALYNIDTSIFYLKFQNSWLNENNIEFDFWTKEEIEKIWVLCEDNGKYTINWEEISKNEYSQIIKWKVDKTNSYFVEWEEEYIDDINNIDNNLEENIQKSENYENVNFDWNKCEMFDDEGNFLINSDWKAFISLWWKNFDFLPSIIRTPIQFLINILWFVLKPINELINILSLIWPTSEGDYCFFWEKINIQYQKAFFWWTSFFDNQNITKWQFTFFDYFFLFIFWWTSFFLFLSFNKD